MSPLGFGLAAVDGGVLVDSLAGGGGFMLGVVVAAFALVVALVAFVFVFAGRAEVVEFGVPAAVVAERRYA